MWYVMLSQLLGGAHSATISVQPPTMKRLRRIARSKDVGGVTSAASRRLPRTIETNATAARTPMAVRLARFSAVHGVNNSTPTMTTVAEVTSPVRNVRRQLTSVHWRYDTPASTRS